MVEYSLKILASEEKAINHGVTHRFVRPFSLIRHNWHFSTDAAGAAGAAWALSAVTHAAVQPERLRVRGQS